MGNHSDFWPSRPACVCVCVNWLNSTECHAYENIDSIIARLSKKNVERIVYVVLTTLHHKSLCDHQIVCCLVSFPLSLISDTTHLQFNVCVCVICILRALTPILVISFSVVYYVGMGETEEDRKEQNKKKTQRVTLEKRKTSKSCCCWRRWCYEVVKSKTHITA